MCAAILAAGVLAAAPASAGIGAGVGSGINIVQLGGVLGKKDVPGNLMDVVLVIGSREIPFSVTSARRLAPSPSEGVGILMAMGPGTPHVVLAGESAFVSPIEQAPAGTEVTILGNLTVGMRYLELLGVDLPPLAGAH